MDKDLIKWMQMRIIGRWKMDGKMVSMTVKVSSGMQKVGNFHYRIRNKKKDIYVL